MKSGSNGVTRIPIHLQPLTGSGPSNQQEPIATKTSPNISPKQAIDSNIHNKTHTKGNGVYDKNSPSPSSASSRSSLAACQCRLHWQPRQLTRRLHQSSPTSQQPPPPPPPPPPIPHHSHSWQDTGRWLHSLARCGSSSQDGANKTSPEKGS